MRRLVQIHATIPPACFHGEHQNETFFAALAVIIFSHSDGLHAQDRTPAENMTIIEVTSASESEIPCCAGSNSCLAGFPIFAGCERAPVHDMLVVSYQQLIDAGLEREEKPARIIEHALPSSARNPKCRRAAQSGFLRRAVLDVCGFPARRLFTRGISASRCCASGARRYLDKHLPPFPAFNVGRCDAQSQQWLAAAGPCELPSPTRAPLTHSKGTGFRRKITGTTSYTKHVLVFSC